MSIIIIIDLKLFLLFILWLRYTYLQLSFNIEMLLSVLICIKLNINSLSSGTKNALNKLSQLFEDNSEMGIKDWYYLLYFHIQTTSLF